MNSTLVPLFPLNLLPLPGETVALHVFEERYQALFNRLEAMDLDEFGIPFVDGDCLTRLGGLMRLIFAFGLAFELPVILLLLARAGLVTHQGLAEKRKIAIVVSFVAAAILTPPDVISQLLLAIPIIVLYEMSILGARWISPPEDNEFNNS